MKLPCEVKPQAAETWEVIGPRPYWLWGFEIGVNEWGVAIGNEAVHTREPDEEVALIGMDLVRLGLERARTADEAVSVIGELVERYGQGGTGHLDAERPYWSSFLVADGGGAWVLETSGTTWAGGSRSTWPRCAARRWSSATRGSG